MLGVLRLAPVQGHKRELETLSIETQGRTIWVPGRRDLPLRSSPSLPPPEWHAHSRAILAYRTSRWRRFQIAVLCNALDQGKLRSRFVISSVRVSEGYGIGRPDPDHTAPLLGALQSDG